jgi:hypothetical protein
MDAQAIPWFRQKTTWTAIGGGVTAIGGYLSGEIGIVACIGSVFAALAVIFGRQGIEKSKPLPQHLPSSQRGETP